MKILIQNNMFKENKTYDLSKNKGQYDELTKLLDNLYISF